MRILEFERPVYELEEKIRELEREMGKNPDLAQEIAKLREQVEELKTRIYSNLTRWQRVQLARHPERPHAIDYIERICDDFIELHGDRLFRDDPSIVGGLAVVEGVRLVLVGQEKGRKTEDKLYRNFGMTNPEGYRKAMRLFDLAAKFGLPVLTLVDTPGAYPGIGAEERGQFSAIAYSVKKMLSLPVPIVVVIIGEGGSGGALAIATGDRVLAMEYSIYSVISPEGAASILWRDASLAPKAAEALKLTAPDLLELGVVEELIPEPEGGAHRDPDKAAEAVKEAALRHLGQLMGLSPETLIRRRWERYRRIGFFVEEG